MARKAPWINLLKLVLTVAAVFLIARKVDFTALWPILKRCDFAFLAASVAAQVATSVLIAWRWSLMSNTPGLPLRKYLYFVYLGYFFNSFLPSSATSEAIRVLAFGKKYGSVQQSIGVNLLGRGLGFALQMIIAGGSLWYYRGELTRLRLFERMHFNAATAWAGALLLAGAAVAAWLLRGRLKNQRWIGEIKRVLADGRVMAMASLLTLLIQVVTIFGLWALFMALFPQVRLWQIVLFPAIIQAILVLPISFGGVGVREYLNLLLFSEVAGIPRDTTFAVSILGYVPIGVMALLGWLWMLYRRLHSDE